MSYDIMIVIIIQLKFKILQ